MKTLREIITGAEQNRVAIGHFNFSNLEGFWGIVRAARNLQVPVILGLSEGERHFVGVNQAVALVESARREFDHTIFLNADHTYSFEKVQEAIDAGFDMVIFDGAKLPLEENIKITKQCIAYAKSKDRDIIVEGELGYIGGSSKILDVIPEGASTADDETLTRLEELERFVQETGVDLVAPAVGNLHGMLASGHNPKLDISRVKSLREAGGVPMVLHGGSGISNEDFKAAIAAGISLVHINTELRVAFRKAVALALQEQPDEIAPYKLFKDAVKAVEKVTEDRLWLFNQTA